MNDQTNKTFRSKAYALTVEEQSRNGRELVMNR